MEKFLTNKVFSKKTFVYLLHLIVVLSDKQSGTFHFFFLFSIYYHYIFFVLFLISGNNNRRNYEGLFCCEKYCDNDDNVG